MSCGKFSTCTNIAHVQYVPYPHVVQLAHGDMNSYNREHEREKQMKLLRCKGVRV